MHNISFKITSSGGTVSPFIYGQFIEHLGNCIEGGVFDSNSRFSNADGIRLDVLEKVQKLAPPIIRFPGGTVMHIYHWEDAIGPLEQRKKKKNLIWGGALTPEFGTAEFVQYCRKVGAEPMICVNMASGTPEEAGSWVEYCNGTGDTYYANLRREHGYDEPFGVKYWCIGNECYAEPDIGIQNDVQIYIRDAREFIKFMKLNDPTIETVLVGCDDIEGWNKPVLDALHSMTNYLSFHFYTAENGAGLYGPFGGEKHYLEQTAKLGKLLDSYPPKVEGFNNWYRFPPREGKIKLMIDEWNIWQYREDELYGLHQIYNGRDMVWVASMFNNFIADEHIAGCNMAQLCNIIAPIVANSDGCWEQTIFTPCALYRKRMYGERLNVQIEGQYTVDGQAVGSVNAVSAAAVVNAGATCISIVNRDFANEITIQLPFDAECLLCRADARAENAMDKNVVEQRTFSVKANETFTMPAGSFVLAGEL